MRVTLNDMTQKTKAHMLALLVAGVLLAACETGQSGVGKMSATPTGGDSETGPPNASPEPGSGFSCGRQVRFKPTYLPKGWVARLQAGGGGGTEFPGGIGHYGPDAPVGNRAAKRGFADLISGPPPFVQTHASEIQVLGRTASVGDIHEGFSVEFTYRGCDYVLVAYGITMTDLESFAQGLMASP